MSIWPLIATAASLHRKSSGYDAASGTFLSVDPLVVPSDPQSHTGYSYARNNPVNLTDPTGQNPCGGCQLDQAASNIMIIYAEPDVWIQTKEGLTRPSQVTPANLMVDAGAPVEAIGYGAAAAAESQSAGTGGLHTLPADSSDSGTIANVPTPEGKTLEAAMAAGAVVPESGLREVLNSPRVRGFGFWFVASKLLGRIESNLQPGYARGVVQSLQSTLHVLSGANFAAASVGSFAAATTTAETGLGAVTFGTLGFGFAGLAAYEGVQAEAAFYGAIADFRGQ